jgi:hypothetical protein
MISLFTAAKSRFSRLLECALEAGTHVSAICVDRGSSRHHAPAPGLIHAFARCRFDLDSLLLAPVRRDTPGELARLRYPHGLRPDVSSGTHPGNVEAPHSEGFQTLRSRAIEHLPGTPHQRPPSCGVHVSQLSN